MFNRASDMVWQSAVRVRNIRTALNHEDFGFFVHPAQACRTRRAAGHSANDDDFHNSSPVPLWQVDDTDPQPCSWQAPPVTGPPVSWSCVLNVSLQVAVVCTGFAVRAASPPPSSFPFRKLPMVARLMNV